MATIHFLPVTAPVVDYSAPLELITTAVKAFGWDRISPESLTDLADRAHSHGWDSVAWEVSFCLDEGQAALKGFELRTAFNTTMDGFRQLFLGAKS